MNFVIEFEKDSKKTKSKFEETSFHKALVDHKNKKKKETICNFTDDKKQAHRMFPLNSFSKSNHTTNADNSVFDNLVSGLKKERKS